MSEYTVRPNKQIEGIDMFEYDFKMYADDILLSLSNPAKSTSHLLKLVKTFGYFIVLVF